MWSEYYTCKECEDEVNRKGHLTKHQEAVHVENVKNNFNFEKSIISVPNKAGTKLELCLAKFSLYTLYPIPQCNTNITLYQNHL